MTLDGEKPDVVVGLDARGFLFGPSLALRLGAGFAPVRKRGKLPGPTAEAAFEKEYGQDFFQIQADAIQPGQKVLVVDDIIATGKPNHLVTSASSTDMLRWICCCCRSSGREARRKAYGLSIHPRTRFLEGSR